MSIQKITETTRLSEILKEYPWIVDEAVKMDGKFRILKTPVGKMFLKNATIRELCSRSGLAEEELIQQISDMIQKRGRV